MKNQTFKLTTLCLCAIGASQIAVAETAVRQTLPQFQAKDIPVLCDEKINEVKNQLKNLETLKLKQDAPAAPVLAEWDRIFASFEDFYGPIGLYSNVSPDEAVRKASDDCEIKISQFQTDILQN
ncbi:MAG TPA: Zn-dependent oligopeptidase, partial [Acinetobacter sp.]|nr:Zn-dependent oligopeptidase [Acinetobacter sp.]